MSKVHFYTTDPNGEQASQLGYQFEKNVGYVLVNVPLPQKAPLYRYFHPTLKVHFYTTHPGGEVATQVGYKYEGFVGYIDTKQIAGTTPLHRWFNPFHKDHFYTTASQGELAGVSPVISTPELLRLVVIRR
jgi:hypothetical protein